VMVEPVGAISGTLSHADAAAASATAMTSAAHPPLAPSNPRTLSPHRHLYQSE
jgi:hypothetical protein